MPVIIIFRSCDDRDYDKFILAPEGLGISAAASLADEVAAAVKAELDDWQWADIEDALQARGFREVAWAHCSEQA